MSECKHDKDFYVSDITDTLQCELCDEAVVDIIADLRRQLQEAQGEVERLKLAELVAETALRVLQEYDEPILGDDGICEMIDDTLRLAISTWQRAKGVEKGG